MFVVKDRAEAGLNSSKPTEQKLGKLTASA